MIDNVKYRVRNMLNKKVKVIVLGMRNHKEEFEGVVSSVSNNIFIVNAKGLNRSFSYADVLIGDVIITIV